VFISAKIQASGWVPVFEQPTLVPLRSYLDMVNRGNLPPVSEANSDFWKGFLLGTVAGMVIAAYSYVMTDFKPASSRRRLAPVNHLAQKPAA